MKFVVQIVLLLLIGVSARASVVVETDVCVYGGAAGGVTAAVQAARMGKTVALLAYGNHLGGLSSAGLGQTDVGNNGNSYIQGMAREFYTRVGAKYGQGTKFTFEPKVAEAVFNEMAQQAGVPVFPNERLVSTKMQGKRIVEITMESGDVFRAKVFIDASYEGDLLKQAGVSYTVGREANSQYGETLNGVQRSTSGNQVPAGIDPYVTPGDSTSGLIRGVSLDTAGPNGSADELIQAYCYRMCLTNVAANRIAVPQPPGYNEADYEILFRAIDAGQTGNFWKLDAMPNGKTDSNNSAGVSCDLIGGNVGYVEADYATRDRIAKAHENWQRGLIWTVQNHPRVPSAIRATWAQWGLPADEFLDTDHWPHQLYVREARRMISDYVMTERNCLGAIVAADSIGLAAYTMDSHNCQRIVTSGTVKNEGDIQRGVPAPYPISYRSIVPKVGECANLLVPWSLSSTHISFGSIRMEPVFMCLGQSAASAACFAIDDGVDVQNVAYPKLRAQMLADGEALSTSTTGVSEVIVDNGDAGSVVVTPSGGWTASTATAGYVGAGYLHDGNIDKGTKSVRFTPTLPRASSYQVFLWWTGGTNRATNVPVDVNHAAGTTTISPLVNQQINGGQWVSLGTFNFNAGASPANGSVLIRTDGTNGFVIADAVRFVDQNATPVVSVWASDATAAEPVDSSPTNGRFVVSRTGVTTSALVVNLQISGTAQGGLDYQSIPATVTIPIGAISASVDIRPYTDALVEGDETVIVSALAEAGYTLDALNLATITIKDRPLDVAPSKSRFVQKLEGAIPQKIVVYGTSLTASGAWTTQLKSALDAAYPGLTTMVNSGGSGMASDWGVANLSSKVIANNPDAVFIEFAVNDAVDRFSISLVQARANLESMISSIQAALPTCEIILQITNPVIDRPQGDSGWRPFLADYQQMYREVGRNARLLVVDHMGAWQAVLDQGADAFHAMVPDGLHPNALGYERYATPVLLNRLGVPQSSAPSLVMDNADATGVTVTGNWTVGALADGRQYGPDYLHDGNADKGTKSVTFRPNLPFGGTFPVYLRWVADPNRATNVPVDVQHATGTATVQVNQQQAAGWYLLGTYNFNAGVSSGVTIRTTATNGFVVADAVGVGIPSVSLAAAEGTVAEPYSSAAVPRSNTLVIRRSGSTAVALDVTLAITGSAINGTDYAQIPVSVTIPPGSSSVALQISPRADSAAEGVESIRVSVAGGTGYVPAYPFTASISLTDRPFDAWRRVNFSDSQLAQPAQSGETADPDGDGRINLVEFLTGADPNQPASSGASPIVGRTTVGTEDYLTLQFTRPASSDIAVIPQVSANLVDWLSGSSVIQETILSDDGRTQTVLARDLTPLRSGTRRFIRLQLQRSP